MDKKLFNEEILSKNIPKSVISIIDRMEFKIESGIFGKIYESEEMREFERSMRVPVADEYRQTAVLLDNLKIKYSNKTGVNNSAGGSINNTADNAISSVNKSKGKCTTKINNTKTKGISKNTNKKKIHKKEIKS